MISSTIERADRCLSDDTVLALGGGHTAPADVTAALAHIDHCAQCAALVAQAVRHSEPEPPRALGRYVPVAPLGRGGMGQVILAFDPELDRAVALKVQHRTGHDRANQRALLREARAVAALDHPNIVRVLDIETRGDELYLAMEYIEGQTLARWMTHAHTTDEVLAVFVAAGRGLAAAHAGGVVHGDFKPANVMVGDSGRIVVVDFGLAVAGAPRSVDTPPRVYVDDDPPDGSATQTDEGGAAGTPLYMAPEQFGGGATAGSDQYAFCLSLAQALVGRPLFRAEAVGQLMGDKLDERFDREAVAELPRALRGPILRGLSAEPDARWPTMNDLLAAVETRRWRTATLAAVGVGAAAMAMVAFGTDRGASPCEGASAELESVWNAERRAAVAERLPDSPEAVVAVERYASSWTSVHLRACEAGRHEATPVLDARMRCLDRRMRRLDEATDAVVKVPSSRLGVTVDRMVALRSPEDCLDDDTVALRFPPPADPELAAEIDELRGRIGAAKQAVIIGDFDAALEGATAVESRARELRYAPLLGEALVWKGEALAGRDDEAALAAAYEAYEVAQAAEDDVSAATASMTAIGIHSDRGAHEDARRWIGLARLHVDRTGESRSRMRLALLRGALAMELGEVDAAVEHATGALEDIAADDPGSLAHATILVNLGGYLRTAGRSDEAVNRLEEAERVTLALAGERHFLVPTINSELGTLHGLAGEYGPAMQRGERAVELDAALSGGKTRYSLHYRRALGMTYRDAGRLEDAEAQLRVVLDIPPDAVDPAEVASVRSMLGDVLLRQGRPLDAREQCAKALAILADSENSGWADQMRGELDELKRRVDVALANDAM